MVAGRLRLSVTSRGTWLGEFVYGRSYLSRVDAVELDPVQLGLTERVRRTRACGGLFGAIRDAIPTSWGILVTGETDRAEIPYGVDYLVQGPSEPVGALDFAQGPEPPRPKRRFNTIDDLGRLQRAADAGPSRLDVIDETNPPQIPAHVLESGPKTVIEDDRTLWVAELGRDGADWNQARVRYATQQLARDCGLDAVPGRIERICGNDILMLRRCDRDWTGDGYSCSRVISGPTLLGTDPTPAETRPWSYLTLADEVRRVSSRPREDLSELFGRMCFNAAISNLNYDLRQCVMVAEGQSWRLAPASGLAPKPLADDADTDFAMICGPEGCSPSRDNLVGGAGRFLLDRPTAEAIFDRISAAVRSSWRAVMRRSGVSVRDCDLVARSIVDKGTAATDSMPSDR